MGLQDTRRQEVLGWRGCSMVRALTVPAENLGLIPSTRAVAPTCDSSSRGSCALLCQHHPSSRHRAHRWCTDIHAGKKTHAYQIEIISKSYKKKAGFPSDPPALSRAVGWKTLTMSKIETHETISERARLFLSITEWVTQMGVSKQECLRGLLGSSGLGSQGQGSSNRNSVTNVKPLSRTQPVSSNRDSDIGAFGWEP